MNESLDVYSSVGSLVDIFPVAENAEATDAHHLEGQFVRFAFILAIVNMQYSSFVCLVRCVHGELLELDAEAELFIKALPLGLRHVTRALHLHGVHEAEVDAANADLEVVENTGHKLLLETARGLAVRLLEQGLLLEQLLKLLQQVLGELSIGIHLLLLKPFALGLELDEAKDVADLDHERRLEHVPDGYLQMDATDKALLQLERQWTGVEHGPPESHISQR